jgi:hypothetical protein
MNSTKKTARLAGVLYLANGVRYGLWVVSGLLGCLP